MSKSGVIILCRIDTIPLDQVLKFRHRAKSWMTADIPTICSGMQIGIVAGYDYYLKKKFKIFLNK